MALNVLEFKARKKELVGNHEERILCGAETSKRIVDRMLETRHRVHTLKSGDIRRSVTIVNSQ